jgi:hypothetical protein
MKNNPTHSPVSFSVAGGGAGGQVLEAAAAVGGGRVHEMAPLLQEPHAQTQRTGLGHPHQVRGTCRALAYSGSGSGLLKLWLRLAQACSGLLRLKLKLGLRLGLVACSSYIGV